MNDFDNLIRRSLFCMREQGQITAYLSIEPFELIFERTFWGRSRGSALQFIWWMWGKVASTGRYSPDGDRICWLDEGFPGSPSPPSQYEIQDHLLVISKPTELEAKIAQSWLKQAGARPPYP